MRNQPLIQVPHHEPLFNCKASAEALHEGDGAARRILNATTTKPSALPRSPLSDEVERLQRENAKLTRRLAQAETIIEVQKKVASLLGIPLKTVDFDESDS